MLTKKIKYPLLFVVALALCLTLTALFPVTHAAAGLNRLLTSTTAAKEPNRMLIVRSVGAGNNAAREMVSNIQVVQQLYYHILSLPPAPTHQICPLYIIAAYQLTFLHNRTTVTKMTVLQGGCPTITLRSGAKRAPDDIFWSLFEQASDFGVKRAMTQATVAAQPTDAYTDTAIAMRAQ
ncbi:MAG TPA: hypothetical protein VGU68_19825 [Ktedonobacteraceae bacterium]|nr:hypothetical protein [Ktedonobacteraceae bacterium]